MNTSHRITYFQILSLAADWDAEYHSEWKRQPAWLTLKQQAGRGDEREPGKQDKIPGHRRVRAVLLYPIKVETLHCVTRTLAVRFKVQVMESLHARLGSRNSSEGSWVTQESQCIKILNKTCLLPRQGLIGYIRLTSKIN